MNQRTGFRVAAALTIAGVLMTGCQNGATGPSLAANFHDVSLQPTVAGLEGGQNVCCCHLAGRVTNSSSVAVDVELRFPARAADGTALGTGMDILTDVAAGSTRQFLAVGITAPCKDVSLSQIVADGAIRLKGMFQPDF